MKLHPSSSMLCADSETSRAHPMRYLNRGYITAWTIRPMVWLLLCAAWLSSLIKPEISYQIRYMERNNRSHGDPWSLRQTGVYHKYSGTTGTTTNPTNRWILLHPMQGSTVSKRLASITSTGINCNTDPLRLHLLITSSYIDNWRLYLHDMTREFLELVW